MSAFKEGLKLGFMFQILLGPVCFYLLQLVINYGFMVGFWSSIGVAIADGIYILLAIFGLDKIFKKFPKLKNVSAYIGMIILCGYGISVIIDAIFIDSNTINNNIIGNSFIFFIYSFILTLSNPITILYWSGNFAVKITNYSNKNIIYLIGLGAFISSPIFLVVWITMGYIFGNFIPNDFLIYIKIGIGILLIYYGIRIYKMQGF